MSRIIQTLGLVATYLGTYLSYLFFNLSVELTNPFLAIHTTAALSTFKPLTSSSPSYSVGIPSGSSISASSVGPLYLQIKAPTSYQWVGFGIGEQMAGASFFILYTDGEGNVTISARNGGQGHIQPIWDEGMQSGVKLLEGSGVVNDVMVANIRCAYLTPLLNKWN